MPLEVDMEIKQMIPIFGEGRLLKKDALDLIRDFAPDFISILFGNYGNGVIAGFSVREAEGRILVGPGILKYSCGIFSMKEEAGLVYDGYGRMNRIVLKYTGGGQSHDFKEAGFSLFLTAARESEGEEYELGRFCLEEGAALRCSGEYRDFYDLATEFNTLNLLHVPYSCENGSCLSPVIFKLYGKAVLASQKAAPLDISFATACLNSSRVSLELLDSYLYAREKAEYGKNGNLERYSHLRKIYMQLAGVGGMVQKQSGANRRTVIE